MCEITLNLLMNVSICHHLYEFYNSVGLRNKLCCTMYWIDHHHNLSVIIIILFIFIINFEKLIDFWCIGWFEHLSIYYSIAVSIYSYTCSVYVSETRSFPITFELLNEIWKLNDQSIDVPLCERLVESYTWTSNQKFLS